MTDISKEALADALYLLECGDQNDALEDLRSFVKGQADHIDAQAATIKALEDALERIASRHVTEGPLWWQVEARTALASSNEPTDARPVTVAEAAKVLLGAMNGTEGQDLSAFMDAADAMAKDAHKGLGPIPMLGSALRALSHEGGE